MPIYEYQCHDCNEIFENWQHDHEDHEEKCPACGGVATRIMSHTSFMLKGGGWYATEYGNRRGTPNDNSADDKGAPAKKEAAPAAKPASAPKSTNAGASA